MSEIGSLLKDLCSGGVPYLPLWQLTVWDKKFNSVTKSKQAKTLKYSHISAGELKKLETVGDVRLLSTGKFDGWTTEELAGDNLSIGEVITIPSGGSANLKYWNGKFLDSGNLLAESSDISKYDLKFVYYYLLSKNVFVESCFRGSGVKHPDMGKILELKVPVPPMEVQKEIVSILDKFNQLDVELSAELKLRKAQYEYYANILLSHESDASLLSLGEIAKYRRGSFHQPYGETKWYGGDEAMPFVQVVDVAKDMRLVEDTKQKISKLAQAKSIFVPKGTVVVTLQGSIGRVAVTQYDSYVDRTLAIFNEFKINIDKKYFAYQLEKKFGVEKEKARGSTIKTITKEEFTKFIIPVPSMEHQKQVVYILDKFNELIHSRSTGLPAEITARRQQYEYYRTKLLTFQELSA